MTGAQTVAIRRVRAYGRMLYLLAGLALLAAAWLLFLQLFFARFEDEATAQLVLALASATICITVGNRVRSFRARIPGIVLAVLLLPAFPFGTPVGLYGLWALLNKNAKELFGRSGQARDP